MRKFKIFIMAIVAVTLFSCEPTYVKEYSWAYPIAGDWTMNAYIDGVNIYGPFEVKSYNSAFGKDSIWIDDYATTPSNGNFWSMKFKVAANMSAKTFQTTKSMNAITGYTDMSVQVTNGKVIGTDSITMDVEFSDDPGTIYQIAGHRTVGYDEYMQD